MKTICLAFVVAAALAGTASGASQGGSVDLVAYSTPKDAYGKIIQAFQSTVAGGGVSFTQSYGRPVTRRARSQRGSRRTSSTCRSTRHRPARAQEARPEELEGECA